MKSIFFSILTLLLTGGAVIAAEVTLVKEGTPAASIVVAKRPTLAAQYAAWELQHHLKLISGAEVPVISEGEPIKGFGIYVGDTGFAKKHGLEGKNFQLEESLVKFVPGGLILIGKDAPHYAKCDAENFRTVPYFYYNHKGSLYAAYNFLERDLGVRWYAPTDAGTAFVPRKTVTVQEKDWRHIPGMRAFRHIYAPRMHIDENTQFSKTDRERMFLRWRHAINYGTCNHNVYSVWYQYYAPAKDSAKAKFFIEKRPEYFARNYTGKSASHLIGLRSQYPDDPDLPPQLCNSNAGVVKHFAKEAADIFHRKGTPGLGWHVGHMEGTDWFYPIEPDDNLGFCRCPDCLELFKARRAEGKRPTNYIHFDWVSRIAKEAAKLDDRIGISTLAYIDTLEYPKGLEIAPNVGIQMCLQPYDFKVNFMGDDLSHSRRYAQWIKAGEPKKRMMNIWTYTFSGSWYAVYVEKHKYFFPMFFHNNTGPVFRRYVKDGMQGWFGETSMEVPGVSFFHTQLESYIASKIVYDPTADDKKLVDEFFQLYFGPAAEPMRKFYDLSEQAAWDGKLYSSGKRVAVTEEFNWGKIGTAENMKKMARWVDEAKKLVKTPQEKQRLEWFLKGIWEPMLKGRANYDKKQQFRRRPVTELDVAKVPAAAGNPEAVKWDAASKAKPWKTIMGFPADPSRTLVFAHDGKFLYLRYVEPGDTSKFKKSHDFWNGDIVEMFFAGNSERPYSQFAVIPAGELKSFGYYYKNMVAFSGELKTGAKFKSVVKPDSWTLYAAIPLDELVPEKKFQSGDTVFANIFRGTPGEVALAWSPVFNNSFHDLNRMGKLRLK